MLSEEMCEMRIGMDRVIFIYSQFLQKLPSLAFSNVNIAIPTMSLVIDLTTFL
jgi:hypothetical protein